VQKALTLMNDGGSIILIGSVASAEVSMTNESKKQKGAFGRVKDAIAAWEKAMDYTPSNYVLDRVCNLEREVLQLRDELRALPAGNSAGGRAKPASSSPTVPR
jgi:hypothetical protein